MMAQAALRSAFQDFARVAAPYRHITDEGHYEEALSLIEELLEEAEDSNEDSLNGLIDILGRTIADYEARVKKLATFDAVAHAGPADVATLRFVMDQHGPGVADFPEIGDKSLISRILSGTPSLTKQNIEKLADRFNISPALFFD